MWRPSQNFPNALEFVDPATGMTATIGRDASTVENGDGETAEDIAGHLNDSLDVGMREEM